MSGCASRHFGELQGRPRSQYQADVRASGLVPTLYRPAGGEDYQMVYDRVVSFLDDLRRSPGNETVLVVTHGGVVRRLLGHVEGRSPEAVMQLETDNASIAELEVADGGTARVTVMNDTTHLDHDLDLAGPRLSMI